MAYGTFERARNALHPLFLFERVHTDFLVPIIWDDQADLWVDYRAVKRVDSGKV